MHVVTRAAGATLAVALIAGGAAAPAHAENSSQDVSALTAAAKKSESLADAFAVKLAKADARDLDADEALRRAESAHAAASSKVAAAKLTLKKAKTPKSKAGAEKNVKALTTKLTAAKSKLANAKRAKAYASKAEVSAAKAFKTAGVAYFTASKALYAAQGKSIEPLKTQRSILVNSDWRLSYGTSKTALETWSGISLYVAEPKAALADAQKTINTQLQAAQADLKKTKAKVDKAKAALKKAKVAKKDRQVKVAEAEISLYEATAAHENNVEYERSLKKYPALLKEMTSKAPQTVATIKADYLGYMAAGI